MNRGLLAALVAVVGAVVYLQVQGDDDELVARGDRGHAGSGASTPARPAAGQSGRADRGARTDRTASGDLAALEPWVADALVQGTPRWQRRADDALPPPAAGPAGTRPSQPSAWDAARPPAPPVIQPPRPTEVVVVPPPAPVAPAFPHQWVGRFNDGAVLSGPESTWVVHSGDVIEGQWRVDRVDERRLSLTYLPLNQSQQVVMR